MSFGGTPFNPLHSCLHMEKWWYNVVKQILQGYRWSWDLNRAVLLQSLHSGATITFFSPLSFINGLSDHLWNEWMVGCVGRWMDKTMLITIIGRHSASQCTENNNNN